MLAYAGHPFGSHHHMAPEPFWYLSWSSGGQPASISLYPVVGTETGSLYLGLYMSHMVPPQEVGREICLLCRSKLRHYQP